MYKIIYLALCGSIFLSANGGGDNTQRQNPYIDKNLANRVYGKVLNKDNTINKSTKEDTNIPNILGITVEGDNIIIDTKKTQKILNSLLGDINDGLGNIEKRVDTHKSDTIDKAGISIKEDIITIDMNKTQNFVDSWADSIDAITAELNRTIEKMEKRLSQ